MKTLKKRKEGEVKMKKISKEQDSVIEAIAYLTLIIDKIIRKRQMPGDGRYQPEELIPFLAYDQWAGWLIIIEWFWMVTLSKIGVMPKQDSQYLRGEILFDLLQSITTSNQDFEEGATKHDIIALLNLMREKLPKPLHRWLHLGATSYDIICTAYALRLRYVFEFVFWPKLKEVDKLWRKRIGENISQIQAGRTHLQTALPVTVGFWLAGLHNRFASSAREAKKLSEKIPGKFSGAVGTSASQRALIKSKDGEKVLMRMLGLPAAEISTQITPPEANERFYNELVLLSGVMANLGEDVRILQSSQFGEITSDSSTSSAMPHKKANPIAAENVSGMHITVIAEFQKIVMTLVSDLQRDLRWSNVMRSFSAVMVYVYQQMKTTERILKSMKIDEKQCRKNFNQAGKLVMGELLHLHLQKQGYPESHHLVNKTIVPHAAKHRGNLYDAMVFHVIAKNDKELEKAWDKISGRIKEWLLHPEQYIGDAKKIARREVKNKL